METYWHRLSLALVCGMEKEAVRTVDLLDRKPVGYSRLVGRCHFLVNIQGKSKHWAIAEAVDTDNQGLILDYLCNPVPLGTLYAVAGSFARHLIYETVKRLIWKLTKRKL